MIIHVITIAITIIKNVINKNSIQNTLFITTGIILLIFFDKIFRNEIYFNTINDYYYLDLDDNSLKKENVIMNLPNFKK